MRLQEFKNLVNESIRRGRAAGLTDEEILWELQEQVRFMTVKLTIKTAREKGP